MTFFSYQLDELEYIMDRMKLVDAKSIFDRRNIRKWFIASVKYAKGYIIPREITVQFSDDPTDTARYVLIETESR